MIALPFIKTVVLTSEVIFYNFAVYASDTKLLVERAVSLSFYEYWSHSELQTLEVLQL